MGILHRATPRHCTVQFQDNELAGSILKNFRKRPFESICNSSVLSTPYRIITSPGSLFNPSAVKEKVQTFLGVKDIDWKLQSHFFFASFLVPWQVVLVRITREGSDQVGMLPLGSMVHANAFNQIYPCLGWLWWSTNSV